MTKDFSTRTPKADAVTIENIMKATGMSKEMVRDLMLMDDELDELCDAALSDLASPPQNAAATERQR